MFEDDFHQVFLVLSHSEFFPYLFQALLVPSSDNVSLPMFLDHDCLGFFYFLPSFFEKVICYLSAMFKSDEGCHCKEEPCVGLKSDGLTSYFQIFFSLFSHSPESR